MCLSTNPTIPQYCTVLPLIHPSFCVCHRLESILNTYGTQNRFHMFLDTLRPRYYDSSTVSFTIFSLFVFVRFSVSAGLLPIITEFRRDLIEYPLSGTLGLINCENRLLRMFPHDYFPRIDRARFRPGIPRVR